MMLEDLENALAEHAPAGGELASELPPLTIDGIPVSVDKMTQVRHGALKPLTFISDGLICPSDTRQRQCRHDQQRAAAGN